MFPAVVLQMIFVHLSSGELFWASLVCRDWFSAAHEEKRKRQVAYKSILKEYLKIPIPDRPIQRPISRVCFSLDWVYESFWYRSALNPHSKWFENVMLIFKANSVDHHDDFCYRASYIFFQTLKQACDCNGNSRQRRPGLPGGIKKFESVRDFILKINQFDGIGVSFTDIFCNESTPCIKEYTLSLFKNRDKPYLSEFFDKMFPYLFYTKNVINYIASENDIDLLKNAFHCMPNINVQTIIKACNHDSFECLAFLAPKVPISLKDAEQLIHQQTPDKYWRIREFVEEYYGDTDKFINTSDSKAREERAEEIKGRIDKKLAQIESLKQKRA